MPQKTPDQDQVLDRVKQGIINYIRYNPGSSKADIIRHLKKVKLASRVTVFEYIKDLEDRNMIYGKKERPHSQSFMMYINEDNKLVSVLIELEEFRKAYVELLAKSKKKLDNRDYSTDAKMLGINETNPSKWSSQDTERFDNFWIQKHNEVYHQISIGEKKHTSEVGKPTSENSEDLVKVIRENPLYFIFDAVSLFYVVVDIMFFRSTVKWPKEINNKEVMLQMYSITYEKIAEIQFELSSFLESIRFGPFDPVSLLINRRYTEGRPDFWSTVYFYLEVNMDSEIRNIIKSIIKLNQDIKDLELFKSDDPDLLEDLEDFAKDPEELSSLKEMLIGHEERERS